MTIIPFVFGIELAIVTVVLFRAGRRIAARFPRAEEAVNLGRWLALTATIMVFGSALLGDATPDTKTPNPVPLTVTSVTAGGDLFVTSCAACHGADGRGRGPLAGTTQVRPANLRSGHLATHTDGDLYYWISNGVAGGMPAWAASLSETDRWNLVNYLRALNGAAPASSPGGGSSAPPTVGLVGLPLAFGVAIGWLALGLRHPRP